MNKLHTYLVTVAAIELVGYNEEIEVQLDDFVDLDDTNSYMIFEDMQSVIDLGEQVGMEQEQMMMSDEDYEEDDANAYWHIDNVQYVGLREEY